MKFLKSLVLFCLLAVSGGSSRAATRLQNTVWFLAYIPPIVGGVGGILLADRLTPSDQKEKLEGETAPDATLRIINIAGGGAMGIFCGVIFDIAAVYFVDANYPGITAQLWYGDLGNR